MCGFLTIEKKCREIHVILMYSSLRIISFTLFTGRRLAKVECCLRKTDRQTDMNYIHVQVCETQATLLGLVSSISPCQS